MEQARLFPETFGSYLEALRDDVNALGGPAEIGEWFWREKTPEGRRNACNACLNAERRERFSDEQIELIMRRAVKKRGYSSAHYYVCDAIGTERPKAIEPEDERAQAMREFTEAVATMGRQIERLERLGVPVQEHLRRKVGA
jgi:hypothetical protein